MYAMLQGPDGALCWSEVSMPQIQDDEVLLKI